MLTKYAKIKLRGARKRPERTPNLVRALVGIALTMSLPGMGLMAQSVSRPSSPIQSGDATPGSPDSASAAPEGLAEIVVTAEKRSENLQRTPISVTALSGDALKEQQVRSLSDAQTLVPGLKVGEDDNFAQITIRGIGSSGSVPGAEGAVAVNVNEVYISRPIAQLASFFDVSSVEALRGPQGTLYGRNATAGAINIVTARPTDEWGGYVRGSIGNYNSVNVEGAVGGPIVDDTLLVRIAGFVDRHDGYGRNLVTGNGIDDKNARAARATVIYKPTNSVKATLILEDYDERDHAGARHYFGAPAQLGLPGTINYLPVGQSDGGYTAPNLRDIAAGIDPQFYLHTASAVGIVEWTPNEFSVKSITAYRNQNAGQITTLDGGSNFNSIYQSGEPANQFSEELQAHYDTSRLHATSGVYYFHEVDSANPSVAAFSSNVLYPAFGIPAPVPAFLNDFAEIGGTLKTKAYAIFGQATYEVLDGLSLTAGIRYSDEEKTAVERNRIDYSLSLPYNFNPNTPFTDPALAVPVTELPKVSFKSTTPKVGIQYQITPDVLAYVLYSQGFKSGSYDLTTIAPAYKPERVVDIEGGLKLTTLNNRLRVNVSAFDYNYSNLQVLQVVQLQVITANAGAARLYGSELEVTALPVDDVTIEANATYLHARYLRYFGPDPARALLPGVDFAGNHLDNAPDFTGHLAVEKRWSIYTGVLSARLQGDYTSTVFFSPSNLAPLSQSGYAKADGFLTYASDARWKVTAFVRNLANKTTRTSANVDSNLLGAAIEGSIAPPRTFGGEVEYRF